MELGGQLHSLSPPRGGSDAPAAERRRPCGRRGRAEALPGGSPPPSFSQRPLSLQPSWSSSSSTPSWASSGSLSTTPPATTSLPRTSPSVCRPALGVEGTGLVSRRGSSGTTRGKVSVRAPGSVAGLHPCGLPPTSGDPGLRVQQQAQGCPGQQLRAPQHLMETYRAACSVPRLGLGQGHGSGRGRPRGGRQRPGAAAPCCWVPETVTGREIPVPFLQGC